MGSASWTSRRPSGLRLGLKWSADFPGVIAEQMAQAYGKQAVCVFTQGASGNVNPNTQGAPDWREKAAVFATAAVELLQELWEGDGR